MAILGAAVAVLGLMILFGGTSVAVAVSVGGVRLPVAVAIAIAVGMIAVGRFSVCLGSIGDIAERDVALGVVERLRWGLCRTIGRAKQTIVRIYMCATSILSCWRRESGKKKNNTISYA